MNNAKQLALASVLLAACAAPAGPVPDEAARREVYDRVDRGFSSAVLFRPPAGAEGSPAYDLAPLLVVEAADASGAPQPPRVEFEISAERAAYRWTFADGTRRSLTMTLDAEGFPEIQEIGGEPGGLRLLFVETALEELTAERAGPPPPGRRYSVERPVEATPGVVVGGLFEPGPTPLGPFVYLDETGLDVVSLICRCMPSRVDAIEASLEYELVPARQAIASEPPYGLLRLSADD